MKKTQKDLTMLGIGFLSAFILWTTLISFIDVKAIGPRGSSVGFAALNQFFHQLTGTNMLLYTVTDWLGLVPIGTGIGFAILGLAQWIKRKALRKVDRDILALGAFYLAVMAVYVFFELAVINYRPILIEGIPEASYPSSTTVLVSCIMPTAIMQLKIRIKSKKFNRIISTAIYAFIAFMLFGRLLSGVHWLTDIIGGCLISAGLVLLYASYCCKKFN